MIEYLRNEQVTQKISQGNVYQKSAKTGLSKIRLSEVGQDFPTYVKHGDGVRVESVTKLSQESVLARNNEVLALVAFKDIYNEWPIPMATAIKNYGQDVIDSLNEEDFTYHKKKATLKAIELTPEILKLLGVQGDVLNIKVSWSTEPMVAHIGDYLTEGGYSISKHDMPGYEKVA